MNKSYRSNFSNNTRYNQFPRYYQRGNKKPKSLYKKILGQLLISIIIILAIILFKSIDTTITNEASSLVKKALNTEYDYKKSMTKVVEFGSKLRDYTVKTLPVFNKSNSSFEFILPLEGDIVSTYGAKYDPITENIGFQKGIDIKGTNFNIVKSIEDGVVETVGESEMLGKFIKVRHSENMFSIYSELEKIYVNKNQNIVKGERLGEVGKVNDSILHFELWIDGEAIDPELYLEYGPRNI